MRGKGISGQAQDYCDGYDYGFSHPHIPNNKCKNFAPSTCNNISDWIEGFKDGKLATGLSRF